MDDLEAFAMLAPDPGARDWATISFCGLCRELKVQLEPGQMTLAMVAYDGVEPRDLPPELRQYALDIFGDVDVIPPEARRVVCIVAGARGGKSYVFGALRLLHLGLTVSLATMAPGEDAIGTIFSGDPRQREQCFKYALGAARSHPDIRAMIQGKARDDDDFSGSEFTLKRRDGRKVIIESLPPKPGGGSGRGRSLIGAVLEECAFFQDENHKVNDVDVFTAVTPRILPGGQTILSSTPWAESGLLYDEFVANHPNPKCAAPHLTSAGRPHRALAAHAPTLLLRDVELTRNIVAAEQARDPANAAREYGAQFLSLVATQFFDAVSIAESVDESLQLGRAPTEGLTIRALGADLGFVNDSAAGMATERTPDYYSLLDILERVPSVERLKPSEVLAELAEQAITYGITDIVADSYYAASAHESFGERNLVFVELPGGQIGKATVFAAAKLQFDERRVRLPNVARLLQQLREVKKRPLPGGGYVIEQPRKGKGGGHGDLVSALVAAIWFLSTQPMPEAPKRVEAPKWQKALAQLKADKSATVWDRIGKRMR